MNCKNKLRMFVFQFKDLMLSVDPPDEDDSDDNTGQRTPMSTTTYTIKSRPEEAAGGDAGTTNHIDNGVEPKTEVSMVDGEQGDNADHVTMDKVSPTVSIFETNV